MLSITSLKVVVCPRLLWKFILKVKENYFYNSRCNFSEDFKDNLFFKTCFSLKRPLSINEENKAVCSFIFQGFDLPNFLC